MTLNSSHRPSEDQLRVRAGDLSPVRPLELAMAATSAKGFTLVEMLVAATLGALLLAAAASTAGSFTQSMAQLQTDAADSYENVVARIDRDVRYAWWADVTDSHRLRIVGSDNLVTEYYMVGNSLLVTRPDGSSGSVITGLDALNFEEQAVQRLRSGSLTTVASTLASKAAPTGVVPGGYAMPSGQTLAISFVGASDAGARSVAGVSDQYTGWQPTTLDMTLARFGTGTLTFRLYYAYGPNRAEPRPGSAPIATWTASLLGMPLGVILVPSPPAPRPVYAMPGSILALNFPALARPLEPGVAYTLTLDVSAGSTLIIGHHPGAARTDQMFKTGAGAWQGLPATIAFTVRGNGTCTTTQASNMTSQVRTSMQSSSGGTYVGSACVYSQVMADDPWLGVVAGEVPAGP